MDMPVTIALTLLFAGVTAFSGWRGARPPDLLKGPRMMPWRLVMLLGAAGCLLMLAHLLNLVGVPTGGAQR